MVDIREVLRGGRQIFLLQLCIGHCYELYDVFYLQVFSEQLELVVQGLFLLFLVELQSLEVREIERDLLLVDTECPDVPEEFLVLHDLEVECVAALGLEHELIVDDVQGLHKGIVSAGVVQEGVDAEVLFGQVEQLLQSLRLQRTHLARHVLQQGHEVELVGTVEALRDAALDLLVHLPDQKGHYGLEQQVGVGTGLEGQGQDLVVALERGVQVESEEFL